MPLWFDMTNSLAVREGGVVGVIKAELEIAKHLKELHPGLRIARFDGTRFIEVGDAELAWLWNAESVGDAWIAWQEARRAAAAPTGFRRVLHPGSRGVLGLAYRAARVARRAVNRGPQPQGAANPNPLGAGSAPFAPDDLVLSYGWMGSGKEQEFERIRQAVPITLVYMIYDLAMTRPEIQPFYGRQWVGRFEEYLAWASRNCDYLLFGGRTAQDDLRRWQSDHGLPSPEGDWVAHGSEITAARASSVVDPDAVLAKFGLRSPFIISVGSLDPKKNYEILYRAYRIAVAEGMDMPQLFIAGGMHGDRGLATMMLADPHLAGRVAIASPSDVELDVLYEAAEFSVLPSLYEGWSLTLPEALAKGTFTLASDVAPLREIGGSLVEYVAPDDPRAWAENVQQVHMDSEGLARRSDAIRREWRTITWRESAEKVLDRLIGWQAAAREARRRDPLAAHGVIEPFVLVLGRVDDAANSETALRAMLALTQRGPHVPRQLVYAGSEGILSYGYLPRRDDDPRLGDGAVIVLDNRALVPSLIERASVVLVTDPHGAEDIATATAMGRSVVAADSRENRGAAGDAAFVSPFDVHAWMSRIVRGSDGQSEEGSE